MLEEEINGMWIRMIAGFTAAGAMPLGALAHHSVGGNFDPGTTIEVEGEITGIHWRNPHVKFTMTVTGGSGEQEEWEVETHSLSIMRRLAAADPFVEIGDRVRAAGWPALRSPRGLFVNNMLLPSGEEFVFRFSPEPADLRWSDRLWGTNDRWFAEAGDTSGAELGIFKVWSTTLAGGEGFFWLSEYPLTDAARTSFEEYDPLVDDPLLNCGLKGMPPIMGAPYPIEFVDEGDTIVLRLEEYDLRRMIYMESQEESPEPSFLGHSTGYWEGDTLVVETTAINYGYFTTNGIPLSDEVEIIERFTPGENASRLAYEITVIDPATFSEPVVMDKSWVWLPDVRIEPYECDEG